LQEFLGQEIAVTEWMELSQERIQLFAEVTGDEQWIHVDTERAKRESPFGGTIAHGFLTLSLLSQFSKQAIQIRSGVRMTINYGLNRVRFPAPVRAGSRIRARVALQALKEIPDALEAVWLFAVEAEGVHKPCCVAEWVIRYHR
jgi:acyl dehydratase